MKRILVAIQDEAMAVFLSEELMEEAYEVSLCSDALTLIKEIRKERPDLVLMDEEFGGSQKAILQGNIRSLLRDGSFIILWRGNRPVSNPKEKNLEGFVLSGFNLAELKSKIERSLEEDPSPRVQETPFSHAPLIQTEFRWVKAD